MRGDKVFRVYGVHAGRERDENFGAFRTETEALAEIAKLETRLASRMVATGRGSITTEDSSSARQTSRRLRDSSPPEARDRYVVKLDGAPATGFVRSATVEVFRRVGSAGDLEKVCEYVRNYAILDTFEPFRQNSGHLNARQLRILQRVPGAEWE